jgi:hypothetical protein
MHSAGRRRNLKAKPDNLRKKINTLYFMELPKMKLKDLNQKPVKVATRALRENYNIELAVERMNSYQASTMLKKVRGLITESNTDRSVNSQSRMKLKFMEQALSAHLSDLRATRARIMFENEEVDKSQVVLAAQEMVDAVQKMVEQVSDMLIKELPAVVDGIESDIGINESQQFSQQVSEALKALQDALTQGKTTLSGAVGTITGQGGDAGFAAGGEEDMEALPEPEDDMAGLPDEELGDMPDEMAPEEPEEPAPAVGRERR